MIYKISRRELANYAIDQLLAGHSPRHLAKQLAAALVGSGRAKEADLLASDIEAELERRKIVASLIISSANRLATEIKKTLVKYVRQVTGVDNILAQERIEPDLLGGFKLETANRSWDKTVKKQLADIKEAI